MCPILALGYVWMDWIQKQSTSLFKEPSSLAVMSTKAGERFSAHSQSELNWWDHISPKCGRRRLETRGRFKAWCLLDANWEWVSQYKCSHLPVRHVFKERIYAKCLIVFCCGYPLSLQSKELVSFGWAAQSLTTVLNAGNNCSWSNFATKNKLPKMVVGSGVRPCINASRYHC